MKGRQRGKVVSAFAVKRPRYCLSRTLSTSASTAPKVPRAILKRLDKLKKKNTAGQELRTLIQGIGEQLGIKENSDWYSVRRTDVLKAGGGKILRRYATLAAALQALYPEYEWNLQQFQTPNKAPYGYWKDRSNLLQQLQLIEQKLNILQAEDWYGVNLSELHELGFPRNVKRVQLAELLAEKYPQHSWENIFLLRGKFAQQKRLEKAIASLLPGIGYGVNVKKEVGLVNPLTGEYLELDIYLPSLCLAFEYQERHHYGSTQHGYSPLDKYQERDRMKLDLAKEKGITLITIPYWWDGSLSSLAATIQSIRPEIRLTVSNMELEKAQPIPSMPPPEVLAKFEEPYVEGIGTPINATFLTSTNLDPTDWWMFEKYDGLRGFWNPEKKTFYSRLGNAFTMPHHLIDGMPSDIFLDGELWFGRENFQEAMKISNRVNISDIDWPSFKYMVFDCPSVQGTYQQRYEYLVEYSRSNGLPSFVEVAPMHKCKGIEHMEEYFQEILDRGGEGVILRNPTDVTTAGRSSGFLKHKKFRDAEARVIGPAGKYEWECELPNQIRFTAPVGSTEFTKKWHLKAGDIVSFKHRGFLLASKKPKLPSIYRLRQDITWGDVVNNWKEQKRTPTALPLRKRKAEKSRPKGYWMDVNNRRKFFIDFAQRMGFDPFQSENWKGITNKQIVSNQGGGILFYFNGSLRKTLKATFPELTFKAPSMTRRPRDYWKDEQNRKQFFIDYARGKGFDPYQPSNWRYVTKEDIKQHKGRSILELYNGSLKKALDATFGFKVGTTQSKWKELSHCRKFFDAIAEEKGFNALDPEGWYSIDLKELRTRKGGAAINRLYGGWKAALKAAYGEDIHFARWPSLMNIN